VRHEPTLVLAGQPVLEYQPAVDLATGRLLGFEALVRWDHPTRGHIPPEILIPWAEANDDIVALNAWVLREACRQAQRWPSGIQLAVNCSIVQLRRGEASRAVAAALEDSGLNPDRLTVEVTERTIADERAAAELRALSALGVHLAVDDVGTNWTSLQPLRRFAVETVKIDGAFVTSLEPTQGMNRAIVEAIVHVAHSLAMSTVAEGVETSHQVAVLREFGADVAQGFFFARPLPDTQAEILACHEPRAVFALTDTARGSATTFPQLRHLTVLTTHPAAVPPVVPGGVAVPGSDRMLGAHTGDEGHPDGAAPAATGDDPTMRPRAVAPRSGGSTTASAKAPASTAVRSNGARSKGAGSKGAGSKGAGSKGAAVRDGRSTRPGAPSAVAKDADSTPPPGTAPPTPSRRRSG